MKDDGSLPHADIALNIATILRASLQGRYKVRNSDAKVGISEAGPFVYPDVFVTCDDRDRTAQAFSRYPCLIVEVMSPSTEAYDRGGKFALYRRIDTLQEYMLVSSEAKTVDVFRQQEKGLWTFMAYGEGDQIPIGSLDLTLQMQDIYDDVVLQSPEP